MIKYICSFCGEEIPPGKGKIVAFNTGKIHYYCSRKCEINHLVLKRHPEKIKWTEYYRKEKLIKLSRKNK